ncbi:MULTISPECIES: diguanylate cyclase [unclassified Sphingomonas]|uniref:GGDEF domain-containing protein n=1 Tax=unclassified Sphingomonas TaxID=196159 RepID=UPI00226AEE79|nr:MULTISPECIES: diguanylate cyclase [unclassified Sphingomonas]
MTFGRCIRTAVAAAMLLCALLAATAVSAAVRRPIATCVLRDAPGLNAVDLLRTPGRFDCRTPQSRFGAGDFWVVSERLPAIASSGLGLDVESGSVWQNRTTLYVLYADGALRRTGFSSARIGDHLLVGALFTTPLTLPGAAVPPVRLLWHIKGAANTRGIVIGPELYDHRSQEKQQVFLAGFYGSFIGLAIALIVYNLALWRALRQRFQPVYCALVLCLLGYALSSSAILGLLFPGLANNDRMRLNIVLLGASAVWMLLFARTFFERRVFEGPIRTASTAVMVAIGFTSVLMAATLPWHATMVDRLNTLGFCGLIALVPAILWRAWRMRSRYLVMFALAWGVPVAFTVLRIAEALKLLPWSFWIDNSTVVAMMLEALLSSMAIAYRIKLLSLERDEAREQESAARILADIDPLTGLLNRRAFLARAIERKGEQMLLIADLDHFKAVNETIGHDGGDEVLRIVARALRAAVPADALVARIGGEEFAIIVDATAGIAASDILAALRTERMPFDLRVTASIGTCNGPITREADWNTLYREADRALFEAKSAGRDRARRARRAAA